MKRFKIGVFALFAGLLVLTGCSNKPEYTVTFDSNGGTSVADVKVHEGETISKPSDPTRSGYKFLGWFVNVDDTTSFDFSTKITGNMILKAKWSEDDGSTTTTTTKKGNSTTKKTTKKKTTSTTKKATTTTTTTTTAAPKYTLKSVSCPDGVISPQVCVEVYKNDSKITNSNVVGLYTSSMTKLGSYDSVNNALVLPGSGELESIAKAIIKESGNTILVTITK